MTPAAKQYENDRRAGKTNPDLVERRDGQGTAPSYNRAYLRSLGNYNPGRVCPPLSRRVAKKNAL